MPVHFSPSFTDANVTTTTTSDTHMSSSPPNSPVSSPPNSLPNSPVSSPPNSPSNSHQNQIQEFKDQTRKRFLWSAGGGNPYDGRFTRIMYTIVLGGLGGLCGYGIFTILRKRN